MILHDKVEMFKKIINSSSFQLNWVCLMKQMISIMCNQKWRFIIQLIKIEIEAKLRKKLIFKNFEMATFD